MSFFIATVGELIIIELCVLWIWFRVLFNAIVNRQASVEHNRLLITALGLVLSALAITGIMVFRLLEFLTDYWPFVPGIVVFYVILALGNIMFIIAAAIGKDTRTFKAFLVLTAIWSVFCTVYSFY